MKHKHTHTQPHYNTLAHSAHSETQNNSAMSQIHQINDEQSKIFY